MPKVAINLSNVKQNATDGFPKLKLEKDQRSKIVLLEEPEAQYVHELRMPKIDAVGKPKMIQKQTKAGESYDDHAYDFVGRYLCNGDWGSLEDKGVDPKNCSLCKYSREHSQISPPKRRFAVHVAQYKIKPNSWTIQSANFSVDIVVWGFTESVFVKLAGLIETYGDLRKHDLNLGPCIEPTFQKFDIQAAPDAEWLANDSRKQVVKETFAENHAEDLAAYCGRTVDNEWMEEEAQRILKRWRQINGTGDSGQVVPDLKSGLEGLLDDPKSSGADKPKAAEPVKDEESSKEILDFDSITDLITN